jgi:hypothetical protein
MIGEVVRGSFMPDLISYLFGPGKREVLQGSPGRRMMLHQTRRGELLQQTSMGVVLVVAAGLTLAVPGQGAWCNTCGVTTRR